MAEKFQVGDVVMIKSGGPKMVVTYVEDRAEGDEIYAEFFNTDKAPWKKTTETFLATSLKLLERAS